MLSALTARQRLKYFVISVLWLAAALYFWVWWLRPEHNLGWLRLVIVSACIGWVYFMQVYFVVLLQFAKVPNKAVPLPPNLRVATIVTKTPSEPFSVARLTLEATLAQTYPHDNWLADENPSAETIDWCRDHGVRISCRKDDPAYHQDSWPRRKRCKEGNLAYFYDNWGYADYDFVAQFDTDHAPEAGYLQEVLRPFADPEVGYVSAPSVCSRNENESWAARARLHQEAAFHGILQCGFAGAMAPMCIGSHYAVRTNALKDAGGLGPELAEDHSTSMLISARGWKGVHAIDAHAIGDGPANAADLVTQEFQWSRSLVTLLLQHSRPYLAAMPLKLRFQFAFCQLWYPLYALCMLVLYLVPVISLVFDTRFADVTYPAFIGHSLPTILVLIFFAFAMRRDGFFRPHYAPILSLDKGVFMCLQWPWVLWGSFMAILNALRKDFVDFRVTPKGDAANRRIPKRVINVYGFLALGCLLPVLLNGNVQNAKGFYLLSTLNGLVYTLIVAMIAKQYLKDNKVSLRSLFESDWFSAATACGLAIVVISAVAMRGQESLYALSIGLQPLGIVKVEYAASGAGRDGMNLLHLYLKFWWQA